MLGAIAGGEAVESARIELSAVLPHLECSTCGVAGTVRAVKGSRASPDGSAFTIQARRAARPADVVRAMQVLGHLGLGTERALSLESVQERLRGTVTILREELDAATFARVEPLLRKVWTSV